MFAGLVGKFTDDLQQRARDYIRKQQASTPWVVRFRDMTEAFIRDHKLVLSDVRKLLNQEDPSPYKVYTMCIVVGNHVAIMDSFDNAMHAKVSTWTEKNPASDYQECKFKCNNMAVATMYNLPNVVSADINDKLWTSVQIDSLKYLPPEIELISIYHLLYSPENVDKWVELMQVERQLRKYTSSDIKSLPAKHHKKRGHNPLVSIIFQKFIKDRYVIVGNWGAHLAYGTSLADCQGHRLQVISKNPIQRDFEAIKTFLKQYTQHHLELQSTNVRMLNDFRLKRHTIYVLSPDGYKKPLLDIFENGTYELIPYTYHKSLLASSHSSERHGKCLVGTAFVLMHFAMVDHYTARAASRTTDERVYLKRVAAAQATIDFIKKMTPLGLDVEMSPEHPIDQYFGVIITYKHALKLKMQMAFRKRRENRKRWKK